MIHIAYNNSISIRPFKDKQKLRLTIFCQISEGEQDPILHVTLRHVIPIETSMSIINPYPKLTEGQI